MQPVASPAETADAQRGVVDCPKSHSRHLVLPGSGPALCYSTLQRLRVREIQRPRDESPKCGWGEEGEGQEADEEEDGNLG